VVNRHYGTFLLLVIARAMMSPMHLKHGNYTMFSARLIFLSQTPKAGLEPHHAGFEVDNGNSVTDDESLFGFLVIDRGSSTVDKLARIIVADTSRASWPENLDSGDAALKPTQGLEPSPSLGICLWGMSAHSLHKSRPLRSRSGQAAKASQVN